MQTLSNRQDVLVCSCCLGPLPCPVEIHLACMTDSHTIQALAEDPGVVVGCTQACGELYCSVKCRDQAWHGSHCMLCVGHVPDEEAAAHPLVQFKVFAVQTNEILLLASAVLARMILHLEKSDPDTLDPFSSFVQEPWDTVVQPSADADNNAEDLRGTLRSMCDDAARLLREAFGAVAGGPRERMASFVTADRVSRIVGMFEQNQLGIRCRSPLRPWVEEVHQLAQAGGSIEELERLAPYLRDLAREAEESSEDDEDEEWESEDEEESEASGAIAVTDPSALLMETADLIQVSSTEADIDPLFQPLDGTALFSTTCIMNHSCDPNVAVSWADAAAPVAWRKDVKSIAEAELQEGSETPTKPLTLEVRALRDIGIGEELRFTYISKDLPRKERKRALAEYGFACKCELCFKGLK